MGLLQYLYEWFLNDVFGTVDNPLLMQVERMAVYFAWIALILVLAILIYLVYFVIDYITSFLPL